MRRQQPVAHRHRPFATRAVLFIELAEHARTLCIGPVVQFFLDCVFENLALFFNHQNFLETAREGLRTLRLERPDTADLVQTDADARAGFVVEAEIGQRLTHIEVRLAAGHDAETRVRRIDLDAVEFVRAHIGERRVPLVVEQTRFLHQRRIRPADVQAAFGHREVVWQNDFRAVRIDVDRSRRFDHVGHALHRHPEAGIAAHRPAVQAEIQIFLHVRGKQHRQATRLEDVFRLVCECRRFGGVVVAGEHENAAVLRRAGRIGVLEDVTGTVDARTLAVPHREHAIVLGARVQIDLL